MRLIKSIIFLVIFTLFLTGCEKQSDKIELKFTSWGSKSEISILKPLIEDFECQNPDITINFIHTPNNYFQKLHLLAASNLMPDVVFINNLYGPLYAGNNIFMDLNGFLEKSRELKQKDFFPEALNAFKYKEKLYAIPRDISTLVIYYNKDLFRKYNAPLPTKDWTFKEFIAVADKLTKDFNNDGKTDLFGVSFEENPLFWLPFLWSNGGGFISADLKSVILDKPESIEAIQLYSDLRNKYHVAPTKSEAGSATMAQLFMEQKLAMHFSGRWFVPIYRQEVDFKWDIINFPHGKAGSVVGCDSSGWAISSKTKHPEAAWRFISFLASKNSIENFTKSGLITPARIDVASSEAFLDKKTPPLHSEIFIDVIKTSISTPVSENYQQLIDILKNELEPVWAGEASAKKLIDKKFVKKLEKNLLR
ncbi:MAG TPA: sugar ABC transporter substrate-binding protein [Candidatus Gastranaerophilales bacterium]|nr:sugar ABC transporter substrate-binding protein [Candidatus Gastranaerophilales bacterium]